MNRRGTPVNRFDDFIPQLLDGRLLRYDRGGAGRRHGFPRVVVGVDRQSYYDNVWIDPLNQGGRLDTVQSRHVDVHDDH